MTPDAEPLMFVRSMLVHTIAQRSLQLMVDLALDAAEEYERIALAAEADGKDWVRERAASGAVDMLDQAVTLDRLLFAMHVLAAFSWRWFDKLIEHSPPGLPGFHSARVVEAICPDCSVNMQPTDDPFCWLCPRCEGELQVHL